MRRVATFGLATALAALALAVPAVAGAKSIAPPGQSEADQYFETVPAAAGPRSPDGAKREADAVGDGSLSAKTGRALARGAEGTALATAVARTAPAAATGSGERGAGASRTAATGASAGAESGGLGVLFPLALIATALAAVAFAIARSRRPVAGRRPATR